MIDEHNRDVVLAWKTAALHRQPKRLPELKTLLVTQPRAQTVSDHRAMLQILSEQYGIPLRKAKGRKAARAV